jgi:hypothetical protein
METGTESVGHIGGSSLRETGAESVGNKGGGSRHFKG